jgi:serine/threonine protein kinase
VYRLSEGCKIKLYLLSDALTQINHRVIQKVLMSRVLAIKKGAYNQVQFTYLHADGLEAARTSVAISLPHPHTAEIISSQVIHSQKWLAEHRIDSGFIQKMLYFNEQGLKITLQADIDLRQFIDTQIDKLSAEDVKKIIGQIVLAVSLLHTQNLAHRDIKPANILMTKGLALQLADLDSLVVVDKSGKSSHRLKYLGGKKYWAPEVNVADRHNIDLKAADCFSVGITIQQMINKLKPEHSTPELADLVTQLTNKSPIARYQITETFGHSYFGSSTKVREKFFKRLKQTYDRPLMLDHITCHFVPPGNILFLLPPGAKKWFQKLTEVVKIASTFNALKPLAAKVIYQQWQDLLTLQTDLRNLAMLEMKDSVDVSALNQAIHNELNIIFEYAWPTLFELLEENLPYSDVPKKLDELVVFLKRFSQAKLKFFEQTLRDIIYNKTHISLDIWLTQANCYKAFLGEPVMGDNRAARVLKG